MKKIALNKKEKKSLKIKFEIHDVLSIKTRFLDRKHSAFQFFPPQDGKHTPQLEM